MLTLFYANMTFSTDVPGLTFSLSIDASKMKYKLYRDGVPVDNGVYDSEFKSEAIIEAYCVKNNIQLTQNLFTDANPFG